MTALWLLISVVTGAIVLGAVLATVFWWLMPPRRLAERWSAPVRQTIEAGFIEQALQQRLRSQAEAIWARQQQEKWREDLDALHSRHETRLIAEIRLLMGSRERPTPVGLPPRPSATSCGTMEFPARRDDRIDVVVRQVPEPVSLRRRMLTPPGDRSANPG